MSAFAFLDDKLATLGADLRFGLRMLVKDAGFSALGVLTLALGISGNIIIFSFFNAFYLRPFPFKEPNRLVDLNESAPRWNLEYTGLAYPDFHGWREGSHSFEAMGAWKEEAYNVAFGDAAERIGGVRVTHDLAITLGIQPALGRLFSPDDDRPGAPKVVVLGYKLWQRAYGGSTQVLGRALRLNQEPYTIVGVLPRDTGLMDSAQVWVPLAETPASSNGWYLNGVGRLKSGVTLEQARADLLQTHRNLIEQHRANENTLPRLTTLSQLYFGPALLALRVFLVAGALLLVIACGNIAALMLARCLARSREFGVRLSLGATPSRIAQLIGLEALLLCGIAGGFGVWLAHWGLKAVLVALARFVPTWVRFDFDWRIAVFTVLITVLAALLGALPAVRSACYARLQGALQSSGLQSTTPGSKRRGLQGLVIAELAATLVLMVQAGLLLQAFRWLQRADQGYRPDHLLLYEIALPAAGYGSNEKRLDFYRHHLEAVRNLPGVVAASGVSAPPLGGHWGNFFTVENAPAKGPNEADPVILQRISFPGYFQTMGVRLQVGRDFTEADGMNPGSMAVVVNDIFAQKSWPGQDPLGKRIQHRGPGNPWLTVVGVVRDVRHYGLQRPMIPGVYLPYPQLPFQQMTLVVRTIGPPGHLVPAIRTLLRQTDAELPMINIASMEERLTESLWVRRVYSCVIGVFAGIALVMAVGGIGGVFAYVVSRRTQEFGVRLALGAQPADVLRLVLRQALTLAGIGLGIGAVLSLVATPLMRNLLIGVSPVDPLTFATVTVLLAVVSLIACWWPARRAMRIEPMHALHQE